MFTWKTKIEKASGRTIYESTQRHNSVPVENLQHKGSNTTKKKQVKERVQSNDGPLYIKLLEPTTAFNALLTHHLYDHLETFRLLGHRERTWARLVGLRINLTTTIIMVGHMSDQFFLGNGQLYRLQTDPSHTVSNTISPGL